ncbi:heme-binding protein [uncultured Parasphingopyxis sp.]|uniref:SOUL family heme-binding protein n=2 Tax=Parasphingopyxis TaxID=1234545 RepID=UPI002614122D|nr:heme-binding protein [uncultured Parasphingopyxis sp.]
MGKAKWIAAAAAGTAAVAAAAYYLHERNTEKPDYDLLVEEGHFALREYLPLIVAETEQPGHRETAFGNGFRILADYIFARSRPGAKIAMTAPVLCDRSEGGDWRTRFIMPSKYRRVDLPQPPEGVAIADIPARRMAAIRFGGTPDEADLANREAALREWMAANELSPAGPPEYAFYNSPFIPGKLRRNEILIPVA